MTLPSLALAVLTLLLTPGPTNTLMALAGAERGFRGAIRLIPIEILAYTLVILPLALLGGILTQALPLLRPVLTGLAGLWVMVLAVKLWRLPSGKEAQRVDNKSVFITTLLNPKALMIGLVLLPGAPFLPRIALVIALIGLVAVIWSAIGACMAKRRDCPIAATPILLRRAAGLWLGLLSLGLIAKTLAII